MSMRECCYGLMDGMFTVLNDMIIMVRAMLQVWCSVYGVKYGWQMGVTVC